MANQLAKAVWENSPKSGSSNTNLRERKAYRGGRHVEKSVNKYLPKKEAHVGKDS